MRIPPNIFPLPGNSVLSATVRDGVADCHIWSGPELQDSGVLTGAGFYRVMDAVKSALDSLGVSAVQIFACDDRRQRVFERYAKRHGGKQVPGTDPDGDPCMQWVF